MPLWTKKDLMSACKASDPTLNFLNSFENIHGISIDDRTIKKGELFIALIGENFDGHNFVESAISKGACGVLVSNIGLAKKYNGLFVIDTKEALINIGKFARNRFNGTTIGITGSSGKTSTNYFLSNALNQFGKTHKTFGNNENDVFDVSKPLKVSSRIINDFHPLNYAINIPEVIVHSSNIGSAKIAEKFGSSTQLKYLRSLGLLSILSLEIPELGKPQVLIDKKVLSTMTISYGHGISITPMHLASATATIVNSGAKVNPTLIKGKTEKKNEVIISNKTSLKMKSIMRLVVSNKYGTAKKAEAPGYLIGGKTGTAEKIKPSGGYSKKENIVAFTGAFPMNDPEFIITIMIDNPKGQKFSFGYRTAGWVVAPIVKKLVTRVAPILGVNPQLESSSKFSNNLLNYKIRGKNHGANL